MQIVISANTSWYIYNFRLSLIKKIISNGQKVVVIAKRDEYTEKLIENGIQFIPVNIDCKGINPIKDLILLREYFNILKRLCPKVFLGYTIKPNIYGSLVCRLLKIPTVLNISGLGTTFIHSTYLTRIVSRLYKISLTKAEMVFSQNRDDFDYIIENGLILKNKIGLLPGSGVDLIKFKPREENILLGKPFKFLLIGRMLADKGIYEYIDAGKILRKKHKESMLQLLGFTNCENRSAIPIETINDWVDKKYVTYFEPVDDVRPFISQADCVVLPSYREGVPRSLLEAASMGKPIITTDAPGCRVAVDNNITGYLCKVKDSKDLADKMQKIIELNPFKRNNMGINGRKKMQKEFDEKIVINKYLEIIKTII